MAIDVCDVLPAALIHFVFSERIAVGAFLDAVVGRCGVLGERIRVRSRHRGIV